VKQLTPEPGWPDDWKLAHFYDSFEIHDEMPRDSKALGHAYSYLNRRQHTLELIAKIAPAGSAVLDVAGGHGNFTLSLAEMGYEVTWNDLRADLAQYVQMKHEAGTVHYAPGNVFDLSFENRFDVVLITEIIEHVAHPDQFLAKVGGFVRPGGHIVMTTPNGGYFRNRLPKFSEWSDPSVFEKHQFKPGADGHIFLMHRDEIAGLARQAGLEVVETRLYTNMVTNGWAKTDVFLHMLPRAGVTSLEALTQRLPLAIRTKICTAMGVLLRRPAAATALTDTAVAPTVP